MREAEICNAKITGTMLGKEDHGILTFYIYLEFQGSGCGFGCYSLQGFDKNKGKVMYSGKGLEAIVNVIETVGVEKWEDLKGKFIRIRIEYTGWEGTVTKIGNLMEDKWFSLKEFFKESEE